MTGQTARAAGARLTDPGSNPPISEAWTTRSGSPWRVASSTARSTACRLDSDPSTPTTSGSSMVRTASLPGHCEDLL